jgi:thioesterase domain-containing protein
MAHSYVDAIRRIQPNGPYHIGGWSLGGVVAYEMAFQLEALGQDVGSLLLLDSAAPAGRNAQADAPAIPVSAATLYQAFMWELLRSRRDAAAFAERMPAWADTDDKALEFILARAVEESVLPATGSTEMVRRLFEVFHAGIIAIGRYRPATRAGAVTLLRAAGPLPNVLAPAYTNTGARYGDATNGWDHYATGELTVIEVPGDHLTMIEGSNAATLAARLGALLISASAPQP